MAFDYNNTGNSYIYTDQCRYAATDLSPRCYVGHLVARKLVGDPISKLACGMPYRLENYVSTGTENMLNKLKHKT